jgi:tetratricopeptide (TPR) repeat protein
MTGPGSTKEVPMIDNLTERRVPQYLAIYLGAAWGLVQFVDFIGTRYALSPRWTDLALLTMVLLLPSVVLYTYHHGRKGKDQWQKSEKIFIPINMLLLVVALTFVGAGTNLGAVTTRIKVTDEKGNTVEAVVPNKAFRKRVAMFMFDAAPGDTASQWLSYGVPYLIQQDLAQQNFVEVVPSVQMRERLRKAGFASGADVPLTLKRDIIGEMNIEHFVTGRVEKVGADYVAHVQIYETKSAKLVHQSTVSAPNAYMLGDEISVQLLKDLDVPVLADSKPDMPLEELMTKDPRALRSYVDALRAIEIRDDWNRAAQLIDQAVKLDPTFANAHLVNYSVSLFGNKPQQAMASIQAALDHSYRLPDRSRDMIKAEYYFAKQDYPHAYAVLDMLSKLYPDDIEVHTTLLRINQVRANKDAIIDSYNKILELDPSRTELHMMLGTTYMEKGDAKAALKSFEAFTAKAPNDARGQVQIGNAYRTLGEAAMAKAAYNKALLLKPEDVQALIAYAELETNLGEFAGAVAHVEQALTASKQPAERALAFEQMAKLQEFRGELRKAVSSYEAALQEEAKYQPVAATLISGLRMPGRYARIDRALGLQKLAQLRSQLVEPWSMYLPIAEVQVYDEIGDSTKLAASVAAIDLMVKNNSFNFLRGMVHRGQGILSELRGDYASAVRSYEAQVKLNPLDVSPKTPIGRSYRKLGKNAEAERALNEQLRVMPAHGPANYELALVYQAKGDRVKAKQHVDRALATWQNADPAYKRLAEAKALAATL